MVIGTIPDKLKDDKRIDLLVHAAQSWVKTPVRHHDLPSIYMDEDDLSLISDELRVKVDSYQDEVQADMTDILEKLYRTGEGSSFIMNLMSSNSLSDTLEQYEVLDSDDYSPLSLETLQAMIQQDLAISSQDYFGDLVHLALQKDLLDQKSHFLQHYVATVMEGIPQERDQRALVLD